MTPSDRTGRSLRLLLELGRGGMGVVYLALHQGPGGFSKLKVVKRLRPDLATEPTAVTMFLEEGRLSARLHHPNVVQTNEVGFDGKHYFLEMEYLEGQSLEALVKRASRVKSELDRPVALWVLCQALAGLHYAHELTDHEGAPLRLVHRDVSPHNVFVTYDGQVKVLDFGIAKAADSQHETQTGVLKGKVTYMSPEQVARKPLDRRADVFAAGVILWQILTGERLWKDLDDFEIFLKLRTESIPSPRSVRADVPEALDAVCMRALARAPEQRTATAADLEGELEAWLESSGVRVSAKEVMGRMTALFAEDRTEVRAEIDRQLRATPATDSAVGVPMLQAFALTQSRQSAAGTSNTVGGEGTHVRQQRQIRGMRAVALGAIGVALVASVGASVATVRGRHARATANANASATIPPATAGCTSNRACAESHEGKAWVCRASDHECVAVDSEDCKAMYDPGDLTSDDTVWLGAAFPTKGEAAAAWGNVNIDSINFARSDIARVTNALGAASATQRARPIALIGCDDSADVMRAAKHMVDDVGVPAIIGFRSTKEIVNVATNLLIPRQVLTLASLSENPAITHIPQPADLPRMVWRTTVNLASVARATAHFANEVLEPPIARVGQTMRVALVHDGSDASLSFASTFYRTLAEKGNSAIKSGKGYVEVTVGAPSAAEHLRIAGLLSPSPPNVIVLSVPGDQRVLALVEAIETRLGAGVRPTYLLINSSTKLLKPFVAASVEHRHRVFGVDGTASSMPNARFVIRYNQAHDAPVTREKNAGVSYDAFYLLAYSTFLLAPGEAATGPALAQGFARLMPPGKSIEFGPNDMLEGLSALSSGGNIDVVGTQGDLDFDLATGEAGWDIAFFCPAVDAQGRPTDEDVESGALFRERFDRIDGAPRCQ